MIKQCISKYCITSGKKCFAREIWPAVSLRLYLEIPGAEHSAKSPVLTLTMPFCAEQCVQCCSTAQPRGRGYQLNQPWIHSPRVVTGARPAFLHSLHGMGLFTESGSPQHWAEGLFSTQQPYLAFITALHSLCLAWAMEATNKTLSIEPQTCSCWKRAFKIVKSDH